MPMTLLLPLGLLALLTLPVIVLLHLIRERRRRVPVPSLLLWMQTPRREDTRSVRRLPLTLLLLLHLLVAAALGLAVARPQILAALVGGAEHTAIVIDTSTSMAARSGASARVEQARSQAQALVAAMGPGDRVTLVAAGPAARVLASGDAGDRAVLLAALDRLGLEGAGADLDGGLTLAEAAIGSGQPGRIVVLTDGSGAPVAERTLAVPVDWRVVGAEGENRAIVAFAARPFGNTQQVYARIANFGGAPVVTAARLFADDQLVDTRDIALNAAGETELTWKLPSGASALRLEVDGRDLQEIDDQALLTLAVARPINVLLVSSRPEALQRALDVVMGVRVAAIEPGDYAGAAEARRLADLTVFDGFLPETWPDGATLAIAPPAGTGLLAVAEGQRELQPALPTQRGGLLDGLSFGGVDFGPVRAMEIPDWGSALLAVDDTPLIVRGSVGNHEVAIWTFDLAQSTLPNRLAFPLLVARTVRDLTAAPLPQSLTAGSSLTLRPSPRAAEVWLLAPDGGEERAPGAPAVTFAALGQPGWYRVVEQGADGALFEGRVAVNAGSPLEADLRQGPAPTFAVNAPAAVDGAVPSGADLWPWLAVAALALLALEWTYVFARRAW